jgi:hypothetical protein
MVLTTHHIRKVWRKDEWSSLALDTKLFLKVTQEVSKIYVEESTISSTHDVIIVAITDTEYIRSNAIASARQDEVLDS